MTTKLTYWERSPPGVYPISKELHTVCHTGIQDSKEHNCSRNLTRHSAFLQVSHTLKRLTPTAPLKLILPSNQSYIQPRSWHNTAQRVIPPQLNNLKTIYLLHIGPKCEQIFTNFPNFRTSKVRYEKQVRRSVY